MKLTIGELADMLEELDSIKAEWAAACTRANSYTNAQRREGADCMAATAVREAEKRWQEAREKVVFSDEIDLENLI